MVARLFRDHDDVIDWATSPAGPDINRLLVKVNGLLETDQPSLPTELFQCTRKRREKKDFFWCIHIGYFFGRNHNLPGWRGFSSALQLWSTPMSWLYRLHHANNMIRLRDSSYYRAQYCRRLVLRPGLVDYFSLKINHTYLRVTPRLRIGLLVRYYLSIAII